MHVRGLSDPDTEATMYDGGMGMEMGFPSLTMPRPRFNANFAPNPNFEKRFDVREGVARFGADGEGFASESGYAMRGAAANPGASSSSAKKTLMDLTTGPGLGLPIMSMKRPKLNVPVPVWRWSKWSSARSSRIPDDTGFERKGDNEEALSAGHSYAHHNETKATAHVRLYTGFEGMQESMAPGVVGGSGVNSSVSLAQNPANVPILRPLDLDFPPRSTFDPASASGSHSHSLSPEARMHLERDIIGSSSGGSLPPPSGVRHGVGKMSRPSSTPNMRVGAGGGSSSNVRSAGSAWALSVSKDERTATPPPPKIQKKRSRPLGPRWGKKKATTPTTEGTEGWVDMSVLRDQGDDQLQFDGETETWRVVSELVAIFFLRLTGSIVSACKTDPSCTELR